MSFQNKNEPSIVEDPNLIKDKGPSTFVSFQNFEKFFIKGKQHFWGSSLDFNSHSHVNWKWNLISIVVHIKFSSWT